MIKRRIKYFTLQILNISIYFISEGKIAMSEATRCTNCGYDLSGPDYIASTIHSPLYDDGEYYSNANLLKLHNQSADEMICPHCKSIISITK